MGRRWVQASRASRLLLMPRLEQLLEVRCSARQQAMLDKLSRPRRAAAALSVYDMGNGDAAIRVLAHNLDRFICVCYPGDFKLATARAASTCSGTSLPSSIKPATASKVHALAFDEDAWRLFADEASA